MFTTEKIFVGNLAREAAEADVRAYFSKFGEVTACVVMMNRDGSNRGFAFCEFLDSRVVRNILVDWESHYIHGQVRCCLRHR